MLIQEKKTVFFLFINGPHHVYHLIEPALRFASDNQQYKSVFVSGNPINTRIIRDSQRLHSSANFTLIDIPLPLRYRLIKSYKSKLYPPVNTRFEKIIFSNNLLTLAYRLSMATNKLNIFHRCIRLTKKIVFHAQKIFSMYL